MTTNSGQICFAATRLYVQAGIYDQFIKKYVSALKAKDAVIGDPEEDGVEIGPVVDKAQYDRINGIISEAIANKEGTLLQGGGVREKVCHSC